MMNEMKEKVEGVERIVMVVKEKDGNINKMVMVEERIEGVQEI